MHEDCRQLGRVSILVHGKKIVVSGERNLSVHVAAVLQSVRRWVFNRSFTWLQSVDCWISVCFDCMGSLVACAVFTNRTTNILESHLLGFDMKTFEDPNC